VFGLLYRALVFILPAYVANGAPVVIGRLLGDGHPIDFGKNFFDGRRVLGDGKTIEGFVGGVLAGIVVAIVLEEWGLHSLFGGSVLSIGALLGDMVGSFIKRRLGYKRGDPIFLLDQLDFLLGALGLYWLVFDDIEVEIFVLLVLITPILHIATNVGAYYLGLKKVPW